MEDFIAVLEMLVGRCGADPGAPASFRDGEGFGPLLLDKLANRLKKLLLELAVMVLFLAFYQCLGRLKLVILTFSFD